MQDPDSTDPEPSPAGPNSAAESDSTTELQAEYERLKQKRSQVTDPDIVSVLDMRLHALESRLNASVLPDVGAVSEELTAPPEPEEPEETKKLRAELAKLKEKLAQTKDRNIIGVLQLRISQIEPFLPPPPENRAEARRKEALAAREEEELVNLQPPSREQAEEAEKLIRQSMLEKRRGNAMGAGDLLKKAADVAPGSPVVLEALGDDLLERRMTKEARASYKKALHLDPKNVGLERKYAETVLRTTSTMSVENQLLTGMSDSIFISGNDNVAGLTAAKFLSAFVPGVGQLVVGRASKGIVLFSFWVICVGLFALWNRDFEMLAKYARGAGPAPNWRVLIPVIGMATVWFSAMADLFTGQTKYVARTSKVEHPRPPVDLPFE